jgi:hypothetical protein
VRRTPALRAGLLALGVLGATLFAAGCRKTAAADQDIDLTWTLSPAPPAVGPATLTVTLQRSSGEPLAGAAVQLEGHMTHPGMAPVLADGSERAPGVYDLPFTFTMQGDWALLVSVVTPWDARIERRIDVANVRPPG